MLLLGCAPGLRATPPIREALACDWWRGPIRKGGRCWPVAGRGLTAERLTGASLARGAAGVCGASGSPQSSLLSLSGALAPAARASTSWWKPRGGGTRPGLACVFPPALLTADGPFHHLTNSWIYLC